MKGSVWDVVVVGGGPAGTAVALSQPVGRRVLVLERRRAPWRKPCDGILTPMSRRALYALGDDGVQEFHSQSAAHLRVVDRDLDTSLTLPLHDHVMVDREAFDRGLRERVAQRPGMAFYDQTDVVDWANSERGFTVRIRRRGELQTLGATILVDASGAAAIARRSTATRPPSAVAVQLWYPPQGDPSRCDWIFDRAATPYYVWAIHKQSGLVLGGVFPEASVRDARPALARLAVFLNVLGQPWRIQSAPMAMPLRRSHLQVVAGGVLVVGEAAGLINAATGEGISFALRSGLLCGRAIAATPSRADAARLYSRAVAPLCEEALVKAHHATKLFVPERRQAVPVERVLVPVPHLPLELPA